MNHSQQVPSRDQLLAKTGVLLIVDQITPPSGPVAKGVTPVVKARELALFIAVSDDGMVYAFKIAGARAAEGTPTRSSTGALLRGEAQPASVTASTQAANTRNELVVRPGTGRCQCNRIRNESPLFNAGF